MATDVLVLILFPFLAAHDLELIPCLTHMQANNTYNAARPHARMQMLKSLNQAPSAMGDRFQSYRPQQ